MKINQIVFGLFILILCLAGCRELKSIHKPEAVTYSYAQCFRVFVDEVDTLAKITSRTAPVGAEELREQIINTRLAYKRIEFIFDYNHTKFSALNINGGPVFKIDEDQPKKPPIEPNGLQALDELIFSVALDDERSQINELSQELKESVKLIAESHTVQGLDDASLIEAIQSGIVRVFTLGVTGFDTPGSVNGLEEAEVSFLAMMEAFGRFQNDVSGNAKKEYKNVIKLFRKGISQFQNQNFEEFDRMTFLRDCVNPLYKGLATFVILNKVDPAQFKNRGQNYASGNLFDQEFLSKSFYQELSYAPLDNPQSISLGKILFFDPILSKDLKMSCSSCHSPEKAFADGLPTSQTNVKGSFTKRNSPTLINSTFSKRYFHDLRSSDLERQIPHVFDSEEEFNLSFSDAINRLEKSQTYLQLFEDAYGGISSKGDINRRSISNALAAYVNTLVSFDSPFDKYVRYEIDSYSEDALRGFNLFMGKAACGTCHFPPTFNGTVPPFYLESESEVLGVTIGLDTINPILDQDLGRYDNGRRWERWPHLKHAFKTPTIRNVERTAPYMHNGTFKTLEEVMEFYNRGGGVGMGLTIDNQTLSPDPLGLTKAEIDDIIAFMKSLTDQTDLSPGIIELPQFENEPVWNDRKTSY